MQVGCMHLCFTVLPVPILAQKLPVSDGVTVLPKNEQDKCSYMVQAHSHSAAFRTLSPLCPVHASDNGIYHRRQLYIGLAPHGRSGW